MKRTINEFKLNLYESVINLLSEVNNWKNVKHIADGWIKQQNIALENVKYVNVPNIKYIDVLLESQQYYIDNIIKIMDRSHKFWTGFIDDSIIKQFFNIKNSLHKDGSRNTYNMSIEGEVQGWNYTDFLLKQRNTLITISHIHNALKGINHTIYDWKKINNVLNYVNAEAYIHFKLTPGDNGVGISDSSSGEFKRRKIDINNSGWDAKKVIEIIPKIEPLIDQMIKLCDLLKHIKTLIKNPTNSDKQQEIGIKIINTNLSCIFDLIDPLERSTAEMFIQIVTMFNKIEFIKK